MIDEQKAKTLSDFLATLTIGRVSLGLAGAAGSIVLYALWENRATWAPLVWQSPTLLAVIAVGVMLFAVGAAINSLQNRLDLRTAEVYRQMRDQIGDLKSQIEGAAADRRVLQQQINDLTLAEERCQQRVRELTLKLESYAGQRRSTDQGAV